MAFYRKTALTEALQWTGDNTNEIIEFTKSCKDLPVFQADGTIHIKTLEDGPNGEAKHVASRGDWIAKGTGGEFWPIKPEIFSATYIFDHE